MTIASLIAAPSELTDNAGSKTAIVLMTRVRLARNLAGQPFPGWAKPGAARARSWRRAARPWPRLPPLKRGPERRRSASSATSRSRSWSSAT